ncbi:formate dehydrogenase accessory protein FdhE [uncultured Senegalimassilia sp.]|uniref:formate dehydrogenase accessory protein FdhE n=1 Tax=uncultured Senegalimassilia sp. TaxID=1714350 RepID=UPI00258D9FBD|nr:formate dehydrogenase accessory protein FdhE [uncultured Senegalimassilia sp.]
MDLNHIDMAMKAYLPKLCESEQERLRFFRTLWGVQDEVQKEHAAKVEHVVPDAGALKECSNAEQPVLRAYPADIPADALADAAERLAGAMTVFEQFDQATRDALAGVRLDRLVAASDMKLAGNDPSAYVEAFAGLLQDDGLGEDAERMGAAVVSLALRALLEPIAQEVQAARVDGNADQPYPVHCPVCGCEASVAHVGQAGTKTKGRGRALWCAQCGCVWDIERVRCARCGTQNQGHLHFFNVEGDDDHRIATCDECGGYVRTVYQEDGPMAQLYPFSYEVEDVVMAKLDLIAYRQLVTQEAQQD